MFSPKKWKYGSLIKDKYRETLQLLQFVVCSGNSILPDQIHQASLHANSNPLKLLTFLKEYDMRKQPNMFVPRFVYRIRRQHYIYWEISRVAWGLPKTFTYSTYDMKSVNNLD